MSSDPQPSLVVANGTVITLGERCRVLPGHDVVCAGGAIVAVAPHDAARPAARTLDAAGKVVLPGLINAHTHFYSAFARGLGKAAPSSDFREVLEHLWWKLDKALVLEDCRVSALVTAIDAVRHGCTTVIDHHASPGAVRGSLGALAGAVRDVGVRACLCYEVSDRDGRAVAADGIAENAEFIASCRGGGGGELLRALFGLHASFTLGDDTLARAVAAARELGAGLHVHVAEAASDQADCMAKHGVRVVERLHRAGALGPDTIAAHCVHVDEREIALLAESGAVVAHNPQSNMNNAVGTAGVLAMLDRGVRVALGTDAMTADMLEELRAAIWAQRNARGVPSVAFGEAVAMLTRENPRLASALWGVPLGEVRAGAAADLAVLDYDPPTPLSEDTWAGHLVFGLSQARVEATVAAGRVLMEGGVLRLGVDERAVMARARALAARVWERF
jgi:putative selenium metabolism protein SsnA